MPPSLPNTIWSINVLSITWSLNDPEKLAVFVFTVGTPTEVSLVHVPLLLSLAFLIFKKNNFPIFVVNGSNNFKTFSEGRKEGNRRLLWHYFKIIFLTHLHLFCFWRSPLSNTNTCNGPVGTPEPACRKIWLVYFCFVLFCFVSGPLYCLHEIGSFSS